MIQGNFNKIVPSITLWAFRTYSIRNKQQINMFWVLLYMHDSNRKKKMQSTFKVCHKPLIMF